MAVKIIKVLLGKMLKSQLANFRPVWEKKLGFSIGILKNKIDSFCFALCYLLFAPCS